VATDLQTNNEVLVVAAQACYTAQRIYAPVGGELTHGGGIETLAVLAHDADLARVDRIEEPTRPDGAEELDAMRRSREVYGYITDVTEIADDGWYGNPVWADEERAAHFASSVAKEIAATVESILKMRRRGS
jgi:creatinine amidohydrolase/Fe(II)-dependent formamide hydrolase-like protein